MIPHRQDRDPHDIPSLEVGFGPGVDTLDLEGPVEPDAAKGSMGLIAELTAGPLVQPDRQGWLPMRAQAGQREAAPEVAPKHH